MGKDRETVWPEPTIDQAIRAGQTISAHYSHTFSKIDIDQPEEPEHLSDEEAEQRLLDLAEQIMGGTVGSHLEIAKIIHSIGPKMGPMGSVSTEIDLAAFRVSHAVLQKQESFSDNRPQE